MLRPVRKSPHHRRMPLFPSPSGNDRSDPKMKQAVPRTTCCFGHPPQVPGCAADELLLHKAAALQTLFSSHFVSIKLACFVVPLDVYVSALTYGDDLTNLSDSELYLNSFVNFPL
ncbi:hypothetical protein OPV22_002180 [Ensete ventricosum]|uniref:Uncharacterized protein n=1 Tax=Ensete ventricosum TaxID=4639 RepID=A0AAV8RX96_ENSVE|nr:hypothetical protein OPV22_002180 [Ensete ventricosum]